MHYTREDGCRAWLTYGCLRPETVCALLDQFGSAEAVYDEFLTSAGKSLRSHIGEYGIAQLSQQASRTSMHNMLVTMQRLKIGILSLRDERYPDNLRNIPSPPALLFYRGNLDCLLGKCVAVVGSRKASPQGIDVTKRICRDLSDAGVTIISGLAVGIDAAAHEGCLDGKSPTAAVMSCGIDVDYPLENIKLKERIVDQGGVLLSEYPPGSRANRYVFQMRNRIMTGLGRALLMMESKIQSGSMVSVHHALDQGKEVYAYPGIPGTEWAEGAHQLLREGANYFTSAQDILEDLGWDSCPSYRPSDASSQKPALSPEQHEIYMLLNQGELSFDQLASQTCLSIPALNAALSMLQIMGLVKAMPGKCYCRV